MTVDVPLVTVLMPCRNVCASYFDQAVQSVLWQSSSQWRLFIVVDADDAHTLHDVNAGLERLGAPDDRVSVVLNRAPFITGAFNTGMEQARTPYVCGLHSDDLLAKDAIAVLEDSIRAFPDVDYFHSSRIYIDDEGQPISGILRAVASFSVRDFWGYGPVKALHCWKVESARAIGGMDESLGPHGADDYDFSWRMAEAGFLFKAIDECLYYYRDHRRHYRLTTHVPLDGQICELKKILRKHRVPEDEIESQVARRSADYLRQALFKSEADKRKKECDGFDIRAGWRQKFRASGRGSLWNRGGRR